MGKNARFFWVILLDEIQPHRIHIGLLPDRGATESSRCVYMVLYDVGTLSNMLVYVLNPPLTPINCPVTLLEPSDKKYIIASTTSST